MNNNCYEKLRNVTQERLDNLNNILSNNSPEKIEIIRKNYEYLKEISIDNILKFNIDDAIMILSFSNISKDELEDIVKRAKFLVEKEQYLEGVTKDFFQNTEQYVLTMSKLNQALLSSKEKSASLYNDTKQINPETILKEKEFYQDLITNISDEGISKIIDKEDDINLLIRLMSETEFSKEEELEVIKNIFIYNVENYGKKDTSIIDISPIEENEQNMEDNIPSNLEEQNIDSIEKEDNNIDASEQVIDFSFLGENQNYIDVLENIVEENKEVYENMNNKQYYKAVIETNDKWLTDPVYKIYKNDLMVYYMVNKYQNLVEDVKYLNQLKDNDLIEYTNLMLEEFEKLKIVTDEYIKVNNPVVEINEEQQEFDEGKNILFLTDENRVPYILQDIKNEDSQIQINAIRAIEKLRKGYNSYKNTNYSNANNEILLYREFCNSGVIDLAYFPINQDSYILIGLCNNGRDNLNNTRDIDRVINKRVETSLANQIQIYKTLLQNPETSEQLMKEQNTYLGNLKESFKQM